MRILVVDDEPKMAMLIASELEDAGHLTQSATDPSEAIKLLAAGIDLVITDMNMPRMSGIELLKRVKRDYPDTDVILITAYATVETAVQAMKLGAADYLIKPFDPDELSEIVARLSDKRQMKTRLNYFQERDNTALGALVGESDAMQKLYALIRQVAPTDATVLITGESGTGKELVAREIHRLSKRSAGAFVPINCAAISDNLLESELFGYERGAFTGAHRRKPGLIEVATGGTLFLDEIGEMPKALQSKLLRVLQDKIVYHIGGVNPIAVDVRILAATNQDIEHLVADGTFRDDLYFRLAVFPIHIPPLRERIEDIPLLIQHFLRKHGVNKRVSEEILSHLKRYNWRGNVRELENVMERAVILSGYDEMRLEHFLLPSLTQSRGAEQIETSGKSLDEIERSLLIDALRNSHGNKTAAARTLGITRRMVYSRMKKYGIVDGEWEDM